MSSRLFIDRNIKMENENFGENYFIASLYLYSIFMFMDETVLKMESIH